MVPSYYYSFLDTHFCVCVAFEYTNTPTTNYFSPNVYQLKDKFYYIIAGENLLANITQGARKGFLTKCKCV